jgi:hypothetical protein
VGPWSEDTKDFFLFGLDDPGGRGTNDFRSLKENIWSASCVWRMDPLKSGRNRMAPLPLARKSVRMEKCSSTSLISGRIPTWSMA